jgi:hypothetical protein
MKFLDGIYDNKPIMPLNMYYNKGTYNTYIPDDTLDIVFKDMETGKKYVQTIVNPDIEIWITKNEHKNYSHIRNFFRKEFCYPVRVKYKTRFQELAKLMKITQEQVKISPFIFGADMKIEHFYLMNFITEYKNDKIKKLSMGYLDIETDIVSLNRFPEPGEVPINVVTYIDEERSQCYTLILKTENIPNVPEGNPKYDLYKGLKDKFKSQVNDFEDSVESFTKELEDMFRDSYGELNYNILMFDVEIDLINTLFKIIHASDNDFIFIWNLPFDINFIIERIKELGYDPNSIIVNKAFGDRCVKFEEDHNHLVHKRKHRCETYTMPTFIDQMVIYPGIRIAKGKIPSLKLNAIAKLELKDTKLDYTEEGNIRYLPYLNFKKFIVYNVKDTLLQLGINRKTRDADTMYATIYSDAVLPNEVFTSTVIITNSLRMFVNEYNGGYLMGYNKNKFVQELANQYNNRVEEDSDSEEDYEDDSFDSEVAEEEPDAKKKKKDKFQGAFVMNPLHMLSTGYKMLNSLSKFIHTYVIDMDIEAK